MVLTRNKVTGTTADLTLHPNIGMADHISTEKLQGEWETVGRLLLLALPRYGYSSEHNLLPLQLLLLLPPLEELKLDVVSIHPELEALAFLLLPRNRCRKGRGVHAFRALGRCSPTDQGPVQALEEGVPLDLGSSFPRA